MKIILGLTGSIASGKGTVSKYLKEKYKAQTFKFSQILRAMLQRAYLPETRDNLVKISFALREAFGQDILAKIIAGDVQKTNRKIIVVDGVRRPADIKYLKDLPGFKLIGLDAHPKIRYERLKKRRENKDDQTKTWSQFLADQQAETEVYIPELIKKADLIIDNSGSLEELYKKIDNLIK